MRKSLYSLLCLCLGSLSALAQTPENQPKNLYQAPASDFFMLHLQNEIWNDMPDSVNIKGYAPSVGVYINKDFPINNSNFSVSIGLGIGNSNIYLQDDQQMYFKDSSDDLRFYDTLGSYKKYKYNMAFVEAPIELRYFGNKYNRNKGFKTAVGIKVGNLISAHTRRVYNEGGQKYREKLITKRFAESWRLTPYGRMGWGNFSLMVSYQVTSVFEIDKGPTVYPLSIGLCISGL